MWSGAQWVNRIGLMIYYNTTVNGQWSLIIIFTSIFEALNVVKCTFQGFITSYHRQKSYICMYDHVAQIFQEETLINNAFNTRKWQTAPPLTG